LDQAAKLRELANKNGLAKNEKFAKAICITSGKGGVGKSNLTLSLGILLAEKGKKVCMIDADFSLANLHILLGTAPEKNLFNYLKGEVSFNDVVAETDYKRLSIVPASSGIEEMAELNEFELKRIIDGFIQLEKDFDYILIDTAAGIHKSVMNFVYASSITILVATPETTSMTDAYALYKVAISNETKSDIVLTVNMADDFEEGKLFVAKFNSITKKYLGQTPKLLGIIERDSELIKAVKEQIPIVKFNPDSKYTHLVNKISDAILANKIGSDINFVENFFDEKILDDI